jgi:hypothetical protein
MVNSIKLLLISLFVIVCIVTGKAQNIAHEVSYSTALPAASASTIYYQPGSLLSIADFNGKPDEQNPAVAITSSGFAFKAGYKSSGEKTVMVITVFCSFDKNKSWMKERGKTGYILLHEQHHFDISYLASQYFITLLRQTTFTTAQYKLQLEQLYTSAIEYMERMQQQYDADTGHGQITDKQYEWGEKINQLLQQSTAVR